MFIALCNVITGVHQHYAGAFVGFSDGELFVLSQLLYGLSQFLGDVCWEEIRLDVA